LRNSELKPKLQEQFSSKKHQHLLEATGSAKILWTNLMPYFKTISQPRMHQKI